MNKSPLSPLFFKPIYKDYIWGGDRIVRLYDRNEPPGVYAESWEVSDRTDGMSVVSRGPLAGRTLREIMETSGPALLGRRVKASVFPLLIKLIDSRDRLSVQVHPNDESAARFGGEAKTEMWYVLDCKAGAGVFAGLKRGVDERAFGEAMRTKRFRDILAFVPVQPGDAIFIPGGLVHAIDEGCLLLEVQQNSNTTYRIYDWDRVGADGKPRPLHLKEAMQVIRWDLAESAKVQPREQPSSGVNRFWDVLRCPYFRLERIALAEPLECAGDGGSFTILFVSQGRVSIRWGDSSEALPRGTTCLIPASLESIRIEPEAGADLLRVTVP